MADNYRVVAQQETTANVGGTFVPAVKVSFETNSGGSGSVVIPQNQYNVDAVRTAIEARVEEMDKVAAL